MKEIAAGTLALMVASFAGAAVAGPFPWDLRLTFPTPADVQVARAVAPADVPDTCLKPAPKASASNAPCGKASAAKGKAVKARNGG